MTLASLLAMALVVRGTVVAGTPDAAGCPENVLFQSSQVRIYHTLDRHGRLATVLTNLDENGAPLDPDWEPAAPVGTRAATPASPPEAPAVAPRTGSAPLRIAIRPREGAERAAEADEIELRQDEAGGTTVVININNNPPAAPPTPAPPSSALVAVPVALYGGIVGPFHYPEHHHFLGYGHGVRSPSSFSALGLRASDRVIIPDAGEP